MAKRRQYDDKFRASAVVMLEGAGYPDEKGALTRIAEHLGVPAMTLSRWFKRSNNPPPNEIVTEKRADLVEMIRAEIFAALGSMTDARDDASYRDLGTVIGILTDKLQLLTGQPTSREERRVLTDDERRSKLIALYEQWQSEEASATRRDTPQFTQ